MQSNEILSDAFNKRADQLAADKPEVARKLRESAQNLFMASFAHPENTDHLEVLANQYETEAVDYEEGNPFGDTLRETAKIFKEFMKGLISPEEDVQKQLQAAERYATEVRESIELFESINPSQAEQFRKELRLTEEKIARLKENESKDQNS